MKRTTPQATYDRSDDLTFYIHDAATSFRFEIEGSLSGKAARQVEQSWRTAPPVIGDRSLVVALGHLSRIDTYGRALLRRWHESGAQFVVKSPLAKTILSSILGRPQISAIKGTKCDTRVWFRTFALPLLPLITLLSPATVNAATLEPTTSKAWEEYVHFAALRMEQRLSPGKTFLWVDEVPERLARVRAGEIVVSQVGPQNPKRVPSGMIHDWVGAVFIAQVTLKDVLKVLGDYARYKDFYPPTVVDSNVIATGEAKDRFSMVLLNKALFLRTALDTDYESCYVHIDDRRGYSVSRTTRIQEIEEYGAASQRVLREGEGNGIVWRLFSIARYVERDGGVYFELEAMGLSRDIPASLRWLAEPIVRRVSRGSLSTSLRQTEHAVRSRIELSDRTTASGGSIAATARGGTASQDLHAVH
jgi:hypothetical protein